MFPRFYPFSLFMVLALLMVCSPGLLNAIGFQEVSSAELQMTSEPLAPGAPAVILYRQVDRDDDRYTPHEDRYYRIKILTEEGRKYADVEIPLFSGAEGISNLHARTIKANGLVVTFEGKIFEKPV